jgi:hypothetical protein
MATQKTNRTPNVRNRKSFARLCRILAVLALLLTMFSRTSIRGAAADLSAVAADAYFIAFPDQDGVEGYGWPLDAEVTLTIDGTPYASPQTVVTNPSDPSGTYVLFDLAGIHDLVPGEVIELSDGSVTKSHTVTALAVTAYDTVANTMQGVTDSDLAVALWVNRDPSNSQTSATPESGAWKADFSPFDLLAGDGGVAVQQEEDLDATWVNWQIPLPTLAAHPDYDYIEGYDFILDATVTLNINSVDAATATVGQNPNNPAQTYVVFNLQGAYDLVPGDVVSLSDGDTTKKHTVTGLAYKEADPATETVKGTTDTPAFDVQVWAHADPQNSYTVVTPDGGGDWSATLTFDIVPGTNGAAIQADEDSDMTWINWHALGPWIEAMALEDRVNGADWPDGTTVALEINGLPIDSKPVGPAPWDPLMTFVEFDLTSGIIYHLQAGDVVELSGGGFSKTLTVTGLAIGGVNGVTDTVSGSTDTPGIDVETWVNADPSATHTVTTPAGNGDWSVILPYDIVPGTDGVAIQTDGDGDKTWANWVEINDPPVITEGAAIEKTISEDNSPTAFSLTLHATDANPEDTLTWSISTAAAHGDAAASGTGTSKAISYTPSTNYNGPDSFNVQVTDGYETDTITVTLTIQAVNDAPTATPQTLAMNKNTSLAVTLSGSDIDSTTLRYFIVDNPGHGTLSGTEPNVTYTPDTNFTGTDTFTFRANDYELDSVPATITINVNPTNTAPVAESHEVTLNEDSPTPVTLTATDVDEDSLSYSIVSAPSHGALTGLAPNLTYTPDANWSGSDSFTFTANDGSLVSNVATISITVNPVNDAPVLAAIGAKSVNELSELAFTATATDIEGDPLTFSIEASAPAGATIGAASGAFTWTPTEAQGHGSYTFNICVNDSEPKSDCEAITVTVAEVNTAPVLNPIGNKTVEEGTLLTFNANTTDTDLPANTLTYSLISAPAGASIVASTGVFTWTPTPAQGPASYSFAVQVSDGLVTDSETIMVTVTQSKFYLYMPLVPKGP